jgi:hypothetical protein
MASPQEQTPSALLHVMDEVDDLMDEVDDLTERVARLETRTPTSAAAYADASTISIEERIQAAVNAAVKEARLSWEKEKEALEAKYEREMKQLKRAYHDKHRDEAKEWRDTCQTLLASRDEWIHQARRLAQELDELTYVYMPSRWLHRYRRW